MGIVKYLREKLNLSKIKHENLHLILNCYENEFSIKIFSESRKLLFLKKYRNAKTMDLTKIFFNIKKYKISEFKNIFLIFNNNEFCLLPSSLNDTNNHKKILELSLSYDPSYNIEKNYFNDEVSIIFPVNSNITKTIKNYYKNCKISIYHQEFLKLSSAFKVNNLLKLKNLMVIYLNFENIHISILKNNKLVFHNVFVYSNLKKAVYYINSVVKILEIDVSNKIIFYGLKQNYRKIHKQILKYHHNFNSEFYEKI